MKILLLTLLVFTLVATSSGHILSFVFDPACATVAEVASLPVCAAAESEATEKLMKSIADPGRRQCCSITYVVECMRNALHKVRLCQQQFAWVMHFHFCLHFYSFVTMSMTRC